MLGPFGYFFYILSFCMLTFSCLLFLLTSQNFKDFIFVLAWIRIAVETNLWSCLTLLWYILTVSFRRHNISRLVDFSLCLFIIFILVSQVELMLNLEDKDDEYKTKLNEKLQMGDNSGLIQLYSEELVNRLAN